MTSIRSLVGLDVLTVDHVRRRIVSVDGDSWTDEDDITTSRSTIASVFFNGQPISVDEAVRRQTPWVEA